MLFELAVAPVSLEVIEVWWAGSPSATAGNANPGGASGADAAYAGSAGDSPADSIRQCKFIGPFICTADATTVVQYQMVGVLNARTVDRYGMPIVVNQTGQALVADAVEMLIALIPLQGIVSD